MTESDSTLRTTSVYACSTPGGGVMFIPEAIERIHNDILASELNMDHAISYKDLMPEAGKVRVTSQSQNFITRSIGRAKQLLAQAS